MLTRSYVTAVASMIAATVGVGMFTLPYVASQSGLVLVIVYFIALGLLQHWVHKLYAEIVLSTKKVHRLPGYVAQYFGITSKRLVLILTSLGGYGSLLAYTLIGGDFLYQLLSPYLGGNMFMYTAVLLLLRSLIAGLDLKWIARTEVALTAGLFGTILIIATFATQHGDLSNVALWQPSHWLLPYGPIFLAINGVLAVTNVCIIMKKEPERIKSALAWGTGLSAAVMLLFTIVVISLSGTGTTPDALSGLHDYIDPLFFNLLLIVGLATVTTAFLSVAESLEEMYVWDFNLNRGLAWVLIPTIPFLLYVAGAKDITTVISLTGAVAGGLLGATSLALALRVKNKPQKKAPFSSLLTPGLAHALTVLFLCGVAYQLWGMLN